jgi:hypothetical protein
MSENKKVEIPEKELFELQKQSLLHDLEEELTNRLKKRFSQALIIVAVVSFFGIQSLASIFLSQQLTPQIDKAKNATIKAELEAQLASEQLKKALDVIESSKLESEKALKLAKIQSEEIDQLIKNLSSKATDLEVRITRVHATSENVRSQLEVSISKLESKFGTDRFEGDSHSPISGELAEFKGNSDYLVNIYVYGNDEAPLSQEIISILRPLGFSVSDVEYSTPKGQSGKNYTNEAMVLYTEKGKERLELVLETLKQIDGLTLEKSYAVSDPNLLGDIQINFNPKS